MSKSLYWPVTRFDSWSVPVVHVIVTVPPERLIASVSGCPPDRPVL